MSPENIPEKASDAVAERVAPAAEQTDTPDAEAARVKRQVEQSSLSAREELDKRQEVADATQKIDAASEAPKPDDNKSEEQKSDKTEGLKEKAGEMFNKGFDALSKGLEKFGELWEKLITKLARIPAVRNLSGFMRKHGSPWLADILDAAAGTDLALIYEKAKNHNITIVESPDDKATLQKLDQLYREVRGTRTSNEYMKLDFFDALASKVVQVEEGVMLTDFLKTAEEIKPQLFAERDAAILRKTQTTGQAAVSPSSAQVAPPVSPAPAASAASEPTSVTPHA